MLRERQAESQTAKAASGTAIGLLERFESRLQLFRCHPDTGIGDGKLDLIGAMHDGKGHLALFSEFHRIAQQLFENLSQALDVSRHCLRQ